MSTAHIATITPAGGGYLVACPAGCDLGISAHQSDRDGAERRVALHRMATARYAELAAVKVGAAGVQLCTAGPPAKVVRDTDGSVLRGPSLLCGCPLDSGCDGRHPGRLP